MKTIRKFLEKIGSEEDEDSEPDQRFASNSVELKKVEVKKFKTERNPSKYFFPAFLVQQYFLFLFNSFS